MESDIQLDVSDFKHHRGGWVEISIQGHTLKATRSQSTEGENLLIISSQNPEKELPQSLISQIYSNELYKCLFGIIQKNKLGGKMGTYKRTCNQIFPDFQIPSAKYQTTLDNFPSPQLEVGVSRHGVVPLFVIGKISLPFYSALLCLTPNIEDYSESKSKKEVLITFVSYEKELNRQAVWHHWQQNNLTDIFLIKSYVKNQAEDNINLLKKISNEICIEIKKEILDIPNPPRVHIKRNYVLDPLDKEGIFKDLLELILPLIKADSHIIIDCTSAAPNLEQILSTFQGMFPHIDIWKVSPSEHTPLENIYEFKMNRKGKGFIKFPSHNGRKSVDKNAIDILKIIKEKPLSITQLAEELQKSMERYKNNSIRVLCHKYISFLEDQDLVITHKKGKERLIQINEAGRILLETWENGEPST